MPLHQRPYCSACGFIICLIAWALIFPFYWSLNALFSCFFLTTREASSAADDSFCHRPLVLTLCIPLLVILGLVTLPLAIVGVLLWLPCQSCRHSYIYSHDPGIDIRQLHTDDLLQEPFVVASANLCLLPEAIARLHNLSDTNSRACKIGNILSQTNSDLYRDESVFELKDSGNSSDLERPSNGVLYPCFQNVQNGKQQGEVYPLLVNKIASTSQHTQATEGLGAAAADILNGISSHDDGTWLKDSAQPHKDEDHLGIRSHPRELYQSHRSDHSRKSSSHSNEGVHAPVAGLMYRDVNINVPPSRHSVTADCLQVHSPDELHSGKDQRERSHSQSRSRTGSNRLSASASGESGIGSNSSNLRRCSTNRSARNSSSASSSFLSHEDIFCHFISDTFPPDLDFLCLQEVRLRQRQCRGGGIVAFIANVHLQEGRECSTLRKSQLNNVQDWLAEFRQQNGSVNMESCTQDHVAFDVLCGDFNFDNESSGDEECWSHSLMSHYQDPGRICQGKDKPWTVGTELTQQRIHDAEVDNPKGLKDILTAGTKRGEYVESVIMNDETGVPPSETPTNGKRRTDLILYNLETTQTNLNVEEYHFVTQLSSLTDHLALAMKYHVSSR